MFFGNNQIKEEISDNKTNTENSSNNTNKKEETNKENNQTVNTNNNKEENNNEVVKQEPVVTPTPNTNQNVNNNVETTKDELSVISFFKTEDESISNVDNQDDRTLREKAKNAFVTVVDFIFYDKEIKGYTFKELTTKAKLEIIEIALSIDNKIDKHFPDYKDVIKDKYTNIKGKLAVKYLEFTSKLCESVGVDTCNQAKEDFNTMKENFSITWQLIKELASSGSTKVKEFYESWRDTE